MDTCPAPERLEALLADGLDGPERETLEDHLGTCPACQQVLQALGGDPHEWAPWQCRLREGNQRWAANPPAHAKDAGPAAWPTVPGYEILGELGRGGMGVVYKARHQALDRIIALKRMRAHRQTDSEFRRRFRREAETLARLQHPNLVQIHDLLEQDEESFLVLEFVEGGSLAARLREATLAPAEAARLVETLARAMQAAHDAGIVHRDLKPANILLQMADGRWQMADLSSGTESSGQAAICHLPSAIPKITDFGLARRLEGPGETKTGDVLGTPSYMAPEQARGEHGWSTPAVDIYALGAVLYEALTGRPPFRAESAYETLRLVVQEEPVPPSRLQLKTPPDLETICLKCLEKAPARRYTSCAALAEDLRRFQAGEPILARRTPPWQRLGKWAKRRPALAALTAATAVAALTLLAVWLKFTADLREERTYAKEMAAKALQEEAEAKRQKDLALTSLKEARRAAQEYYQLVRDDVDLKGHGLEPLRRRLLVQATQLQEKLVADYGKVPELLAEQATAYHVLGQLAFELGMHTEALRHFRRATQLGEELVAAHPDKAEYPRNLSTCLCDRATVLLGQGQIDEAETAYRRAVACLEQQLPRADPRDAQLWFHLACVRNFLGKFLDGRKRRPEAEAAYLAARQAIDQALERGQVPDYLNCRASICHNLGVLYLLTGRNEDAEASFQQALQLREALVQRMPNYPSYQEGLASSCRAFAVFCKRLGKDEEALTAFGRALDHQTRLVATHPQVHRYRVFLANLCYRSLGDFHRDRRRSAQAAAAYRQAADLLAALATDAPQEWSHVRDLGSALLRLALVAESAEGSNLHARLDGALALIEPWTQQPATQDQAKKMQEQLHRARHP